MSSLSHCKAYINESIWSSLFSNNFKSFIKSWLTFFRKSRLLLIFSIPKLMKSCTNKQPWKMSLFLMWMTSNLSPDDDNSTFHVCILSIRNVFAFLAVQNIDLQTLNNPAMWYHVICFPVITPSHRQNLFWPINKLIQILKSGNE